MTKQDLATELPPLDQIRLAEAEIIRKTMAAHEDAERRLVDARTQAAQIKKEAQEKGIQTGKAHYKELLARAEEEARAITAHAKKRITLLQGKGHARMGDAVETVLNFVLGSGESQ